jgi:hypothetical protein
MTVEDGEETLTMDPCKRHDYGVCVLHETSRSFGVRDGTFKGILVVKWFCTIKSHNDLSRNSVS